MTESTYYVVGKQNRSALTASSGTGQQCHIVCPRIQMRQARRFTIYIPRTCGFCTGRRLQVDEYRLEAAYTDSCQVSAEDESADGGMNMKTIKVVAAVICDSMQEKKRIFATARGYGEFKGQWEFPGGKIEAGETAQQALVREIWEELATTIKVGDLIETVKYDYPDFHLSMDCFWCEVIEGQLLLLEAQEARWLTKDELNSVKWLPADLTLVEKIRELMH